MRALIDVLDHVRGMLSGRPWVRVSFNEVEIWADLTYGRD